MATNLQTNRLLFGGDYNPEQWPESVWQEDVALMQEAGVNIVTLGVFSWAFVETDDDQWDWGWFDRIVGLLADAGIGIDMATPTAAPPGWLHRAHPEIIPVDRRGIRFHQGGRLGWCASHPVWHRYSTRIAERLGERYGAHPAVRMWHVGNELGGGNRQCYCEESSRAFREWTRERYETIDQLNRAWGTAVWGLRYRSFDDVIAPLASESGQNPSLLLAFDRFSSDALSGPIPARTRRAPECGRLDAHHHEPDAGRRRQRRRLRGLGGRPRHRRDRSLHRHGRPSARTRTGVRRITGAGASTEDAPGC